MLSDLQRQQICNTARAWYGTPYVPKGRVQGVGVDCGGLLYEVYNPFLGPFPPFPETYSADWATHADAELYLDFIMPFVSEVPVVKPAGFTLFHLGNAYSHAAIFLDTGQYIHAWGRQREGTVTVTSPRVMNYLAKKHCSGFRAKHFEPK